MKLLGLCLLATLAPMVHGQTVECKVDIAIACDGSGSIYADQPDKVKGRQNWEAIQNFTANLVRDLDIGQDATLVAASIFEDNNIPVFNLAEKSKEAMINDLRNLPYDLRGGRTNMDLVMKHFYENVFNGNDRPDATNVVIILTDGRISPGREADTLDYVQRLRDERAVRFVAVGITEQVDFDQLEEITQDPTTVFNVSDFRELENFLDRILEQACIVATTTTTTTPAPAPSGCPDPVEGHVSFTAYSANGGMILYEDNMIIPFQQTYLNIGNHYDTNTYRFTCECRGIYEFHLVMSAVNPGMMAAIVKEDMIVSPIAYTTPNGAMSTTTIILCDANEQVWAQVLHADGIGLMPCMFDGASFHGFTGKLLTTVN